jgi:hypothetical protein
MPARLAPIELGYGKTPAFYMYRRRLDDAFCSSQAKIVTNSNKYIVTIVYLFFTLCFFCLMQYVHYLIIATRLDIVSSLDKISKPSQVELIHKLLNRALESAQ